MSKKIEEKDDSDTDDDFLDFEMEAGKIINNLLPTKSAPMYEKTYKKFKDWCRLKSAPDNVNESTLLVYFSNELGKLKASTAWSIYSMLRGTICIKENVDIKEFSKLRAYLKKKSKGYHPKKSAILTKEHINRFVEEAPDKEYLAMKVILKFLCAR